MVKTWVVTERVSYPLTIAAIFGSGYLISLLKNVRMAVGFSYLAAGLILFMAYKWRYEGDKMKVR
jgi:hypothetical protein